MDDDQPGRGDLTAERHKAAAKLWALPVGKEWNCVTGCIHAVRHANPGRWDGIKAMTLFLIPDRHPEFLDAVIAEYAARKLLGEIT